ncbi:MAG TPA: hypothetical protein VHV53_09140 [Solirubrobacterales bacterium]|nr:hypothetical protein [Solirubrobacterales bacterium]
MLGERLLGKAFVIAALLAVLAIVVSSCGGGSEEGDDHPFADMNALHEAANEGKEAHGEDADSDQDADADSGEAPREGPRSPASEQVANRAFPRGYVNDRLARQELGEFEAVPNRPRRATFGSAEAYAQATAAPGSWGSLGPRTPNVAGPASQFVEPSTGEGPETQESGRVTALAIDPTCAPGDCRMWVAAAGGGIWRTEDALAPHVEWIEPAEDLPTNAFGSLYFDAATNTLYAGSGEPNGSSDSEAGLGLFRSTDDGRTWSLVPGSAAVATNRSIGAIAISPTDPETIFIGTAVARHGSSSVNGGRMTPPNAPPLGVYRSADGGQTFTYEEELSEETPASPNPAESGADWFQGGVNKLEFDPDDPNMLYAAVLGYGVWRADQSEAEPEWTQIFHTMNQNDFSDPEEPKGDETGDRTEFDLVDRGGGKTRIYVGDASDEWALADEAAAAEGEPEDAKTPRPEAWRDDDAAAIVGDPAGELDNETEGWVQLSTPENGEPGYAAYGWCQNGQCGYDSFVAHPPGAGPNTVWFGGSMNYNELPAYDQLGEGAPPRSDGRAVIRSTNAGEGTAATASEEVEWGDMTAVLEDPSKAWGVEAGIHPDLHAIAFAEQGKVAFVGSDGGVVRINVGTQGQDQSESCGKREWNYAGPEEPEAAPVPLEPEDLADCETLLSEVPEAIEPLNDGLDDLQFQSLSFDGTDPTGALLGGTQDNGTWAFEAQLPIATQWLEAVGGDGGQSGFDAAPTAIEYHNYYDATPEVNFHGHDPRQWIDIYDPLQLSGEERSFYTPFEADPVVSGRAFTGLEHVWRTDDNGGSEAALVANGCKLVELNPFREEPCGDWAPMGGKLTGDAFGKSREGGFVSAIARAPSDTGTLWAATRTGRVFITENADEAAPGAVTFRRIDQASTPERFPSGIAVDPTDPDRAFISYSGYDAYTPQTPGHVFEVVYEPASRSATFTDLSANVGDQPVTGIAFDVETCSVYAATDFGVLERPGGSSAWIEAGSGLPKVAVFGLTMASGAHTLYAATHGRGAYALSLPNNGFCPSPAPSPPSSGGGPGGGGSGGAPASGKATATAQLSRIGTVKLGKPTKVRGRVSASDGIRKVELRFGDGRKVRPKLKKNGRFLVKHRYPKAKAYKVRLVVVGKAGEKANARRTAKVRGK